MEGWCFPGTDQRRARAVVALTTPTTGLLAFGLELGAAWDKRPSVAGTLDLDSNARPIAIEGLAEGRLEIAATSSQALQITLDSGAPPDA